MYIIIRHETSRGRPEPVGMACFLHEDALSLLEEYLTDRNETIENTLDNEAEGWQQLETNEGDFYTIWWVEVAA